LKIATTIRIRPRREGHVIAEREGPPAEPPSPDISSVEDLAHRYTQDRGDDKDDRRDEHRNPLS
jgi:hypothetical protein